MRRLRWLALARSGREAAVRALETAAAIRDKRERCDVPTARSRLGSMDAGAQEDFEAELLDCLVDDTESTNLVVAMLEREGVLSDAEAVERGMRGLQRRGLVSAAHGLHPLRPGEDAWWRLTEAGWLLLAESGRYGEPEYPPLSSDHPPLRLAVACLLRHGPRTIDEIVDALLPLGGRLPPDTETIWPHFIARDGQSADAHRGYVYGHVQPAVGKLALDRIVSASRSGGSYLRWVLTEQGMDELLAQTDEIPR
jgi:hypothetical protein